MPNHFAVGTKGWFVLVFNLLDEGLTDGKFKVDLFNKI